MGKQLFSATTAPVGEFKIECSSRGFSFLLDEPKAWGGSGEGLSPLETLLSAIGACKCVVAKGFAKSQKINLIDIKIKMEGELDTDGFSGKNKAAKIGFSKITSKFYINANNTQEEIHNFIDFIEKTCPVLDTLVNTPDFATEVHISESC